MQKRIYLSKSNPWTFIPRTKRFPLLSYSRPLNLATASVLPHACGNSSSEFFHIAEKISRLLTILLKSSLLDTDFDFIFLSFLSLLPL